MKDRFLIRFLICLVTSGTLTGLLILNPAKAQTPNIGQDPHHPNNSPKPYPSGMGMMDRQQVDRHFIEKMIPHHQGAVEMADLALSKAKRPEIKELAEAIKRDQNREIEQMIAWYKKWYNAEVPTSSPNGMGMSMTSGDATNCTDNQGMPMNSGMGMMGMMGMMNMDLEALENAPDFDKAFIEQMIPHHKMAVMMAGMVLDSDLPEVRDLAKSIIQTQSDEIEQMRQWQQTWYR